jgi:CDP-diacylglycerol--serine O-phosphatidyltransferase
MARRPPPSPTDLRRQFFNPPNWFTAASLFCGMASVAIAAGMMGEPDYYRAALMILFAGVFDTLDGGVARLTRTGSSFGVQLDSLVDAVSFGLAPGFLLYAWGLQDLGWAGLVGAFWFVLCAIFRLARFNCETDGSKTAWGKGLSVTMGAALAGSAVMAQAHSGQAIHAPLPVLGATLLTGLLMVSEVPYRGWKTLKLRPLEMGFMALVLGMMLVLTVQIDISMGFFAASAIYALMGPTEALLRGRWSVEDHEPRLAPAGPEAAEDES